MSMAQLGKGGLMLGSAEPRVFSDFANDAFLGLEFPNQVSTREMGRGGSVITYASNSSQATLTIRLVKGSPDDVFLLGLASDYKRSPESFVLLSGSISMRFGNGRGEVTTENYALSDGIFINVPAFSTSANGAADDGISVWTIDAIATRNFA